MKQCDIKKAELRMLKARHAGKDMNGQLRAYYNLSKSDNLHDSMIQTVRSGALTRVIKSRTHSNAERKSVHLFGKTLALTAEELQDMLTIIKDVKKSIEDEEDLTDEQRNSFMAKLEAILEGNDLEEEDEEEDDDEQFKANEEEREDTEADEDDIKKRKEKESRKASMPSYLNFVQAKTSDSKDADSMLKRLGVKDD